MKTATDNPIGPTVSAVALLLSRQHTAVYVQPLVFIPLKVWFFQGTPGRCGAGKDTFDRKKVLRGGDFGISKVGEAYLRYDTTNTTFIAGRHLLESMLTESNDTKMIPNVFGGVSIINTDLNNTNVMFS